MGRSMSDKKETTPFMIVTIIFVIVVFVAVVIFINKVSQ